MQPKPRRGTWFAAVLFSLTLLGLLAVPSRGAVAQQADSSATVRFVHAFAGGGPVDIMLDGNPIAQGLAFGTSTQYVTLSAGEHGVQVRAAGQPDSAPYVDKAFTVDGGAAYNVIVGGQTGQLDAALFEVDLSAVDTGQARYRVIQASPDLGDVNIQIGSDNGSGNSGTGDTAGNGAGGNTGGNAGFMGDQGYQTITAGTYTVNVFTAANANQAALSAPSITLESGRVYDLIVVGQGADQSLTILPLVTDVAAPCGEILQVGQATDACVRFVHVSPDAGPVDILVDGTPVAQNISYGAVTEFAALAGGSDHQIQVTPTGQGAGAAVLDKTMTLDTGQAYQLAVVGMAQGGSDDTKLTLHDDRIDLSPLPAGQARVRVIHALAGAGDATIATADGTQLFDGIGFNEASQYAVLNAGTVDLQAQVSMPDGRAPLSINASGVELKEGMVYDIFAIGNPADPTSAQLLVLTTQAPVRQGEQGTPVTIGSPARQTTPAPVGEAAATPITGSGGTPVATMPAEPIVMTPTPTPAS